MKKIVVLLILLLIPTTIFAYTNGYEITKYHVKMDVKENNILNITEEITANFDPYEYKHGIYRNIPIINEVEREDGSSYFNRVRIKNIRVNENFEQSYSDNYLVLKIGDANRTVSGPVLYTISYKYDLGDDRTKSFDELYFNIIGDAWDTTISNVSFEINMPKSFDKSKLGFTWGPYGATYTSNVNYTVNKNKIKGFYVGILYPNNALTVRMELPEEYFVNESKSYETSIYFIIIIAFGLLILSAVFWNKYGKDDILVEPVEFYPPENLNSLEIGYIYKGNAANQDVVSLLVYLANKGYLKIEEYETKGIFRTTKSFKIIKLKDIYEGDNFAEKKFFDDLFAGRTEVTESDLKNTFYTTINGILFDQNSTKNKHKIFEKKSLSMKVLVILFIILTFVLTFVIPYKFFLYNVYYMVIFMIYEKIYIFNYVVGAISIIGMIIFAAIMKKRTKYGNNMLGRIKGFRNFLETAEKPKLEALVKDNPTYFYDILPYTYVLGVTNIWMKKFESITMIPPTWYSSNNAFDIIYFNNFMNTTITTANHTMTSRPSPQSSGGSDFGGGFSGGGFSGGGSGGGGGGSW